ncbi:MAG: hypothetical protein ABSC54_05765 [Smithellaceae bacterium]|jgi:hypothetical protein
MKKTLLVLYISLFVAGLVLAGCDKPKPEWVDLGPDTSYDHIWSVNIGSITKIQKEAVDNNIRINSSAPIKRDVYAVWVKVEPGSRPSTIWKRRSKDGRKLQYYMDRYFVDLANHEIARVEEVLYFGPGSAQSLYAGEGFEGVVPGSQGDDMFKVVVKYR